jgi:uncharacterized protein YkwD
MGRMVWVGWGLMVLQAGAEPIDQLRAIVAQSYERRALPAPTWDPELAAVAAEIADSQEAQLGGTLSLRARLQAHGLGDPAPSGLLLEGKTAADLLAALPRSLSPDLELATLFGAGLSSGKGGKVPGVRLVVLRLRRKAVVAPIPRAVPLSQPILLRGRLLGDLSDPSCYSESPDGAVMWLRPRVDGPRFETAIEPRASGRYVVEVMAEGPRGPEMAWIDEVWVGEPPPAAHPPPPTASDPSITPEEQIVRAINAMRARQGEPALALDPQLSAIARAYSQELGELKMLVHRSPRSGDLITRLHRSAYGFQRAGENLGEGATASEAHDLIAASPAHRRNLVDPNFDRCGIGLARPPPPAPQSVILTEIFAGGDAAP